MSKKRLSLALAAAAIAGLLALLLLLTGPAPFPGKPIPIPRSKIQPRLEVSYRSAFLLAPNGSLWTWGDASAFSGKASQVPRRVGEETDWKDIAHAFGLAVALKDDGSLWTWANSTTQFANVPMPTRLGADLDWLELQAGASHALALKRDRSLWAWGQNDRGQVGDGTRTNQTEPVRISPDQDWKQIAAGHFNSYALKSNGTIWCWGMSMDDSAEDALKPALLDSGSNWMQIAAGDYHFMARRADGTLWLIGRNAHVAARDFDSRGRLTNFVQIGADTNWAHVSCGGNNFIARKTDGSWWGCGQNNNGQLGLRNHSSVTRPNPLPLTFQPWAMDTGGMTTLVLMGDGSLWILGQRLGVSESKVVSKVKDLMNSCTRRLGLGRVFKKSRDYYPDPVKLWSAPVAEEE